MCYKLCASYYGNGTYRMIGIDMDVCVCARVCVCVCCVKQDGRLERASE